MRAASSLSNSSSSSATASAAAKPPDTSSRTRCLPCCFAVSSLTRGGKRTAESSMPVVAAATCRRCWHRSISSAAAAATRARCHPVLGADSHAAKSPSLSKPAGVRYTMCVPPARSSTSGRGRTQDLSAHTCSNDGAERLVDSSSSPGCSSCVRRHRSPTRASAWSSRAHAWRPASTHRSAASSSCCCSSRTARMRSTRP
eukprot:355369-Chlamydomonas_euryale.AAC.12